MHDSLLSSIANALQTIATSISMYWHASGDSGLTLQWLCLAVEQVVNVCDCSFYPVPVLLQWHTLAEVMLSARLRLLLGKRTEKSII